MAKKKEKGINYRCVPFTIPISPALACIFQGREDRIAELEERNRMLSDIALSAVALKLMIEHGFTPQLYALNRDLAAFQLRFGGIVEAIGSAAAAMDAEGEGNHG